MSSLNQTFLDISPLSNFAILNRWVDALKTHFPHLHLFVSGDCDFRWSQFCKAHEIEVSACNDFVPVPEWTLYQPEDDEEPHLYQRAAAGLFSFTFEGSDFRIFKLELPERYGTSTHNIVLGPNEEASRAMFTAVCTAAFPLQDEILEFSDGHWSRSKALQKSISGITLASLVLEPSLRERVFEDTRRFLSSKALYEKYNLPWKRGIILIGPPGNGKTMTIKAMINEFRLPALYVRSFDADYHTPLAMMATVFAEARRRAPCFLIFEDLDAILKTESRSFFLNEMDGFASNHGIFTIATTNYPERIEAGLINRPSRFDTSYHFNLPDLGQRAEYLQLLMADLDPELTPTEAEFLEVAQATEGFTMAFLKELFVVSLMSWIDGQKDGQQGRFATSLMENAAQLLAEQNKQEEIERGKDEDSDEDDLPSRSKTHRRRRK